jgi:hypothetical protein
MGRLVQADSQHLEKLWRRQCDRVAHQLSELNWQGILLAAWRLELVSSDEYIAIRLDRLPFTHSVLLLVSTHHIGIHSPAPTVSRSATATVA